MPRARGGRAPRVSSPPTPSARRKELVGKQAVKRKASNGEDDEEEAICSICRFELEDKCKHSQTCPNCRARFQFMMNGTKKVKKVEQFGKLQQPTLWYIHRVAHEKEAWDRIPKDHQDHIQEIHDTAMAYAKVELGSVRAQLRAAESSGKGTEYVDDCKEEKAKLEKRISILNEMKELAVAAFRKGPTKPGHNQSSALHYLPAPGRKCAWNLDYEMRRLLGATDAELFPHPELAVDSVMPSDIQDLIMQAGSIMSDTLRASIMGGLAELAHELGEPSDWPGISRLHGEHIPLPPPYTMVDLFPDNLNDVPMPAGWRRNAIPSEEDILSLLPSRITTVRGSQTTSTAAAPAARRRGGGAAAAAAAATAQTATRARRYAGRGGIDNDWSDVVTLYSNTSQFHYSMEGRRTPNGGHYHAMPWPSEALNPADRPMHNDILETVQITPDHLRANGTIHVNAFAGIAEIVDNSVDSEARKVKIDYYKSNDRGGNFLNIVDDGKGMSKLELGNVIRLGHSKKRCDKNTIGQFGNGLKSGSMRLGETLMVCTRQHEYYFNLLLISLKYLDDVGSNKCYVPMLNYELLDHGQLQPFLNDGDEEKQAKSLEIFCKYTPFATEWELKRFIRDCIPSRSGTCILVADLKKLDNGEYEVLPDIFNKDIIVKKRVVTEAEIGGKAKEKKKDSAEPPIVPEEIKEEKLSDFLADLYLKPKLAIIINGHKLNQRDPVRSLADPCWSPLSKAGLDTFRDRELATIRKEHTRLMVRHEDLKKEMDDFVRSSNKACSAEEKKRLNIENRKRAEEDEQVKESMNILAERLNSQEKEFEDIRVYLGFDVMRRCDTRAVFYTNGRRIASVPFIKHGNREKFKRFLGVVAIIDMPSTFLRTSQSREHYESPAEVEMMMTKLAPLAMQYVDQADDKYKSDIFWMKLGYFADANPWDVPNANSAMKILQLTGLRKLCCNCLEFRDVTINKFVDPNNHRNLITDFDIRPYRCNIDQLKDKTTDELLVWDPEKCGPKSERERLAEEIPKMKTTNKVTYYHRDGATDRKGTNKLAPVRGLGLSTVSRGRGPTGNVIIQANSSSSPSRSPSPSHPPANNKKTTRSHMPRDASTSSSPAPPTKKMRGPMTHSYPSSSRTKARLRADAERRRALAGAIDDDDDETTVERQRPTGRGRNDRAVADRSQSPVLFHDPNQFANGLQLGSGAPKDEPEWRASSQRQPRSEMTDNTRRRGSRQTRGQGMMEESSISSDVEGDARPPTTEEESEDERLVQSPNQRLMYQVQQQLQRRPPMPPLISEEAYRQEHLAQKNRLRGMTEEQILEEAAELNVRMQRIEENLRRLAHIIPAPEQRHLFENQAFIINQIKQMESISDPFEALHTMTRPE
ncbi:hypothetical protein PRIPAC_91495 [Pristionchus pacificus]|uniref:Uncharacterized protein n=1 Tax=Pristionchus pacificus TaxID=54126 RepID=A0A2A6BA36_PRIPA|nr:hypothetical protein PRIPAC_91495 [Pristionchus pacificus]|eukprot:PDM62740.1 hypothetical protein PRIPAC_49955 [Pristionchus pacificus]